MSKLLALVTMYTFLHLSAPSKSLVRCALVQVEFDARTRVTRTRSKSLGFDGAHPLTLHATSFLWLVPRHASQSALRWHVSSPRAVLSECSELDLDPFIAFNVGFVFWVSRASLCVHGDQHMSAKHMMIATTREKHSG